MDQGNTTINGPQGERSKVVKRLGRYHVLGQLGQGGMGAVYEAYDPKLARRLALKVLRSDSGDKADDPMVAIERARLVREAQSLARLSHPNVVAIYDVGVMEDGDVYLAMELVPGKTLQDWLRDGKVSWQVRLGWLLQAGEGLAAAHAAGLVHRDVKPGNIIVGADKRVRLLDFGLATAPATPDQAAEAVVNATERSRHEVLACSEQTKRLPQSTRRPGQMGAIEGTPAYMAPEQIEGQPCDANSDIFAFCCMVYEALAKRHAFPTWPLSARLDAIRSPEREWPRTIGPQLRLALERGLRALPSERGTSLVPLLEVIARVLADDRKKRRQRPWLAALSGVVAGLLWWTFDREPKHDNLCDDPARVFKLDWNRTTLAQHEEAFHRSGVAVAADLWERAAEATEAWQSEWVQAMAQACDREQHRTDDAHGLHQAQIRSCLADGKAELQALLAIWRQPTLTQVLNAPAAVSSLSRPDACLEEGALAMRAPLPVDPERRSTVQALRSQLRAAEVMIDQGSYITASQALTTLIDQAMQVEDPPLLAEVAAAKGWISYRQGETPLVRDKQLQRAILMAVLADRPYVGAEALGRLWFAQVYQSNRQSVAQDLMRDAESTTTRAGSPPRLMGFIAHIQGIWLILQGKHDQAIDSLKSALAAHKRGSGDNSSRVARALDALGVTAWLMCDYPTARKYYLEALDLRLKVMGKSHPDTLLVRDFLSSVLDQLGEPLQALRENLMGLADCLEATGDLRHCTEPQRRLIPGWRALGYWMQVQAVATDVVFSEEANGHRVEPGAPWTTSELARVLMERGELAPALPLSSLGLARLRAEQGVHPEAMAEALNVAATVHSQHGMHAQARAIAQEMEQVVEANIESRQRRRPEYLEVRGHVELAQNNPVAVEWLERALASYLEIAAPPHVRSRIELALAQALLLIDQTDEAAAHVDQALELAREVDGLAPHVEVEIHQTRAKVALQRANYEQAADELELALQRFDPVHVLDNRLAAIYFLQAQVWLAQDMSPAGRRRALARAREAELAFDDWDSGASHQRFELSRWIAKQTSRMAAAER